jgi:2-methylcitrate dehydratase PrpD
VSGGATLAQQLAAECGALRDADLAADVGARALVLFRDYLGVAIGGADVESSVVLRRGLGTIDAGGRATVLGTAERLSPAGAALANGAAAHALEMDDTLQAGSIHLGATVFSAALAAAECHGTSGSAVLRAAVAGYEVAGRLACALDPAAHYRRGFHPTGTCGAFGAAAAAGVVLGLDDAALAAALGIAGSQAAGSMEFLADGAWTKRLHPGWAATAGLHAAALAGAGFRAPASILEGRFGVLAAYSDGADVRRLASGAERVLMQTSIKPHACCRYMQGPIDATLALRAREGLAPEDVVRVEVGMLAAGRPIVCEPAEAKRRPTSVVDAQFSLPFGIAVALVRGAASPAEFTPETCADPAVRALMDRVVAVPDPALDARYPVAWPCWVRIHLAGGRRTLDARVEHPLGDPENFPSEAELDAKFRRLAARTLSARAIEALAAEIKGFANASDVAPLLAAAARTVS